MVTCKKKLVLLGSIGVVAETSEIQRAAYNQALEEAALNWSWDRETYSALLEHTGGQDRLRLLNRATGAPLSDDQIRRIHARKTEVACRAIRERDVALRPGVKALLERCRTSEIPVGLVTTTYPENIHAIVDGTQGALSLDSFAVAISRDDVARGKPDPEAYEIALEKTGISAQDAIAIEDTASSVLSAKQAGVPVIATPGDLTREQSFFNADLVVEALSDRTGGLDAEVESMIFGGQS